ncbi:hypothetical protein BBD42_15545 [Paenibacillus sp. BIHB 4019]|uniref:Uncharacterized protein n=1 Tax=Paenibacillus sp. BIHB 4019 TaxID=1870819 RepID=A0A1B2DJ52_9BACL|nr:hypothetical protein [Paenibacillus sp. BIHB 4019]ANY67721.1 hypothetical protein BBD42_15545 [Paenibacillus sp. BIHB 4019]
MTKKHKGFRELTAPVHFHTAAIDQTAILAFQDGELIGSGRIEEVTDETVRIGDEWFMRDNCTFTYAR